MGEVDFEIDSTPKKKIGVEFEKTNYEKLSVSVRNCGV